jgi:type IV secretory pathway VirB2 component (pilin)
LRTTDIGELIAHFIRALSGIAGSMALLMFVVGGVMWMTAEGSDRVQTAQTILKNSTVGILLIFFAYSIVSLFLSVLGL